MTGSLRLLRDGRRDDPYRRAVVRLDNGSDVAYRDVRRFGTWLLLEPAELEPYLATKVGVEPLGRALTARSLVDRLARRRAPLKAVVLDQRVFAGVGNIYADEALWWARLHPLRPAGELIPAELEALVRGIRRALSAGIARQGATLRDYRTPTAPPARCRPSSASTAARASPAPAAARDREDPRRRARHLVLPALPALKQVDATIAFSSGRSDGHSICPEADYALKRVPTW